MIFKSISLFLFFLLCSSVALGLGSDHRKGDLPPNDRWPTGTYDAINLPCRVHGYWINSRDILFYQADNASLEEMLQTLARTPSVTVRVVLHSGKGVAKSPWSKEAVDSADWKVTIEETKHIGPAQYVVTFDIWTDGNISIEELVIPENVEVTSDREATSILRTRHLLDRSDR